MNIKDIFLKELDSRTEDITRIYYHLFKLEDDDQLQKTLEWLYKLQLGKDDHFKEGGKEDWFFIWHKGMRQGDYFTNCYKKSTYNLLSEDEKGRFKYLRHEFRVNKKEKKSDVDGKLFIEEYSEYLDLHERKRRENMDDDICGHLDMILWNTVHVDNKDVLLDIFEFTFLKYASLKRKELKESLEK